ncbi:hypothetical protein BJY01DRAFT_263340 [Aspergillus pseudoustus]|uniref:Chaperonin 10-like protein n=1 Tax=Aspergillus pseudoustus TaxID=1810923 RepID=A0ABR4K248_9EURO
MHCTRLIPKKTHLLFSHNRICGSDQVRIRIAYCGTCGSDIHEHQAGPILAPQPNSPNPYTGVSLPVTLGHEMSGTITEIGSAVRAAAAKHNNYSNKNNKSLCVGQKVVVNPLVAHPQHAARPAAGGAYYGISADGGGLSSQIVVAAENVVPVPDNVDLRVAALAEPLAVACHMIERSRFIAGDDVLILGSGPIGLALLILLRGKGSRKVIMAEVSELRISQAERLGAGSVVNPFARHNNGPDPVLCEVLKATKEGVDIAFDASGSQATLDTAIALVRPGGTIFNVAIHEKPLSISLNDISISEKRLTGGICYLRKDFEEVLGLLSSGGLPAEEMITFVVPLSDAIERGFQELIVNKTSHVKILIQPDTGLI